VVIGRILFDAADNWIYDGNELTISEQETVAGTISGSQREMNELLERIKAW